MSNVKHQVLVTSIGEHLTSWSLPFGIASQSIQPGDYCCNSLMLKARPARAVAIESFSGIKSTAIHCNQGLERKERCQLCLARLHEFRGPRHFCIVTWRKRDSCRSAGNFGRNQVRRWNLTSRPGLTRLLQFFQRGPRLEGSRWVVQRLVLFQVRSGVGLVWSDSMMSYGVCGVVSDPEFHAGLVSVSQANSCNSCLDSSASCRVTLVACVGHILWCYCY